jgi:hypothetical protein
MTAFLAKYGLYLAAGALGLYFVVKKSAATSGTSAPPPVRPGRTGDPNKDAVMDEADAVWPGGAGDPALVVPADQSLYPGFWRNEYGGFYNPQTGDSFSPGSSPVVYTLTAGQQMQLDAWGQAIGDSVAAANKAGPSQAAKDTQPGGKDYNAATYNAAIY